MRLERFRGTGIYGYLKFDINFARDLTFLTGINGGGKTTVVNAVIALIAPSLRALAELEFHELRLDFENDGKKGYVEAKREDDVVTLSVPGTREVLKFSPFIGEEISGTLSEARFIREYYRELYSTRAQGAVLKFIQALPTPMFLGLDRRAAGLPDDLTAAAQSIRQRPRPRRQRNAFNASLGQSVIDAASLAETKVRDNLIAVGRISDDLKRQLLLQLLSDDVPSGPSGLSFPTTAEVNRLKTIRNDIKTLPKILGLSPGEVENRLVPTLDKLEDYASALPRSGDIAKFLEGATPNDARLQSLVNWSFSRPRLQRIQVISQIVESFNRRQSEYFGTTDKYLGLINTFLHDSGKQLKFDESGYLSIAISGIKDEKPITWLSSGEAQIFVILTHLTFSEAAQAANVFIIDEPELSLHVQWQELFVDSVRAANPSIQYIMATHSPSIILQRTNACVQVDGHNLGQR